jgi:hypothetical protein
MGTCSNLVRSQQWEPEDRFIQNMLRRSKEEGGPRLQLWRTMAPTELTGAARSIFPAHEKVANLWIERVESVKGWAPLQYRYADSAWRDSGLAEPDVGATVSLPSKRPLHMPAGSSDPGVPRRSWRVLVVAESASGQRREQWCMLLVAEDPRNRHAELLSRDIDEARLLASHADAFNEHVLQVSDCSATVQMSPRITVCMPTAFRVAQSPVPQFFAPGDHVLLLPYAAQEISKFVYDGSESFLELPQAFYHFVAWECGGQSPFVDLQGTEDEDGSVLLVHVCMPGQTEADGILGASVSLFPATTAGDDEVSDALFDRLHPHCGPLCKTFDAERRIRQRIGHCGIPNACGLRGYR